MRLTEHAQILDNILLKPKNGAGTCCCPLEAKGLSGHSKKRVQQFIALFGLGFCPFTRACGVTCRCVSSAAHISNMDLSGTRFLTALGRHI